MSVTTSKASKAATLARIQALIAGLQKRFPNGSFTLGNTAFTTAALVQLFQGLADAIATSNAARASAKEAVAAEQLERAKVSPTMVTLKRVLVATFGNAAPILADFGLEPAKARAPRSSLENAAAAAKAKATRTARGTKGSKEKLAVRGNVTGILVIPTTRPAEASPPTAPAPVPASPTAALTGPGTK
jgi:hypothetical protein